MRELRDFQPQKLYGCTQRGNGGQWVHRDKQDFAKAKALMIRYAKVHDVKIHFYILQHSHSHWIFEASTPESISNLMRDMQGQYSRSLNKRYKKTSWLLRAPLLGRKRKKNFASRMRPGPANWTPRFDAFELSEAEAKSFGQHIENEAVESKLVKRARRWKWSSAAAHCAGQDEEGVLCVDRWPGLFGEPWRKALEKEAKKLKPKPVRPPVWPLSKPVPYNRPQSWVPPLVRCGETTAAAGGLPD